MKILFLDVDGVMNCQGTFTGSPHARFPIDKYAILDDDSDMLPEQMPNFFKTSWLVGITDDIAKAVIEHLNK